MNPDFSADVILPEIVRPFPKATPRKKKNKEKKEEKITHFNKYSRKE